MDGKDSTTVALDNLVAHDAFIVMTDLEPDDMVAIIMFLEHLKKRECTRTIPLMFLLGEGGQSKEPIMSSMLRRGQYAAWFKHMCVADGQLSDKDYPETMFAAWGVQPSMRSNVRIGVDALYGQLRFAKKPYILCLKPPRELFACANAEPKVRLDHATLALYGSFNLRSLKADPVALAHWLHTAFNAVVLYESYFATGEANSLSPAQAPAFWEQLDRHPVFAQPLAASVEAWNMHIVADCLDSAAAYANAGNKDYLEVTERLLAGETATPPWGSLDAVYKNVDRNMKIVGNIAQSNGRQMVVADFGLVAVILGYGNPLHLERCAVSFNAHGYTVATPDLKSRVYVVNSRVVPFQTTIAAYTRALPQ